MTDEISFKVTEDGIICIEKVTTTIERNFPSYSNYTFIYHNWTGHLSIIFDDCSLGD